MRVLIEAENQTEFDLKRHDLLRTIAGDDIDIEKSIITPHKSPLPTQNEMVEYWQGAWQQMINQIKKEVGEILN